MEGKLIVFEGGDGTGKSTQVSRLQRRLSQKGFDPLHIREPGSTPLGEKVRSILIDGSEEEILLTPEAEMLLFMACRAELFITVILPALQQGRVVLLERSYFSTYAYQGAGLGMDKERILRLGQWVCSGVEPTRVILLDMKAEEGVSRIGKTMDRVESRGLDFHEKVRAGFLDLAGRFPDLVRIVDATGSKEAVESRIYAEIQDLF